MYISLPKKQHVRDMLSSWGRYGSALLISLVIAAPGMADQGVSFTDIATQNGSGLHFRRTASASDAAVRQLYEASLNTPVQESQMPFFPARNRGLPGVAVLDYDGDGDLDIYASNGPGSANSLFTNQLVEQGETIFIDQASAAGVAATDQDSNGVCYGDIDNDGDPDLLVLGRNEPHRMFENNGDGTFTDISSTSRLDANQVGATSCSFGDVDQDGLLDVVVAHAWDFADMVPIFIEPYALSQPTALYRNTGNGVFTDISERSGIRVQDRFPDGAAGISWAIAMVDVDRDGAIDIVIADDQGGLPSEKFGGLDRGFIQVFKNDGTGHFTATALGEAGSWMGLSFADFNCDRHLDVFGSNFGDYGASIVGFPYDLGDQASRWFLGTEMSGFTQPDLGELVATPFGWGSSAEDFDNDGDPDIVFHGGLDLHVFVEASNPGSLLINHGCTAEFSLDLDAFETNHVRRNVQGVATGDLNRDGWMDIVSTSNLDIPEPLPLEPFPIAHGSPFDDAARFAPRFDPVGPGEFVWTGIEFPDGGLSVELNNGETGHGSVVLTIAGSVDLTPNAVANRDGIGAVVTFAPEMGNASTKPVVSGGSYLSQHSLELHFGLGEAAHGVIEIMWPGGVRNRLYDVSRGEQIVIPEIPCSFDADWNSQGDYLSCVNQALNDLAQAGVIAPNAKTRYRESALQAYQQ